MAFQHLQVSVLVVVQYSTTRDTPGFPFSASYLRFLHNGLIAIGVTPPHTTTQVISRDALVMSDMDVFAAMGIAGFGKAAQKRQLDPSRFDKNKREVRCSTFRSGRTYRVL